MPRSRRRTSRPRRPSRRRRLSRPRRQCHRTFRAVPDEIKEKLHNINSRGPDYQDHALLCEIRHAMGKIGKENWGCPGANPEHTSKMIQSIIGYMDRTLVTDKVFEMHLRNYIRRMLPFMTWNDWERDHMHITEIILDQYTQIQLLDPIQVQDIHSCEYPPFANGSRTLVPLYSTSPATTRAAPRESECKNLFSTRF